MAYSNASAPDFGSSGVDGPPIDVDEIMFSMEWPDIPIRQMEADSPWWEQVPKENVSIFVKGEHSDEVERMFPAFCAQNRARLQKDEDGSKGGFFGSKKKNPKTKPPITTNAINVSVTIENPQGVNDLVYAMNSAVFPGPAILSFRVEGSRDYAPTRDAESWKLLASCLRKCYPQFMSMDKIEITGQDIGDEALIFLASAVAHYPRLNTIDLFENHIQGKGAVAFFKVVTKNKTVKSVNLGKNILDMNDKTELQKLADELDVDCDTY